MTQDHSFFMRRAIAIAQEGIDKNLGGPFGCVIARDGRNVGEGSADYGNPAGKRSRHEILRTRGGDRLKAMLAV